MKKIQLLFGLILLMGLNTEAQVSVNVNFGTPPVWAPAERVETQYYYLPDVDAYYDVPSARFIYIRNGSWIRSSSLPYRYRNYNLRGGNVIYLTDYRGSTPYKFHKNHKIKYGKKVKYVNAVYKREREKKHHYEGNDHDNSRGKERGHGKGHK